MLGEFGQCEGRNALCSLQFPPQRPAALWWEPEKGTMSKELGQLVSPQHGRCKELGFKVPPNPARSLT